MAIIGVEGKDYWKVIKLLRKNKIPYKYDLGFYFENLKTHEFKNYVKKIPINTN